VFLSISGGVAVLGTSGRQQGFFDAAWCVDLLAEGSIYRLLAEHGERIVRDEDFAECYSSSQGRPSIPPSVLAKVLLLAFRDGLSDERAMEAVRFDLRWKVALGLPVDHPGFHATSLVRFRARLLLCDKELVAFERSVELAGELGLVSGGTEQILDSTPMLGAAAVQDTVTLVRAGVRKLIDAVNAADRQAAGELRRGVRFDYSQPRVRPEGDWQDREARMALLGEIARDAERAVRLSRPTRRSLVSRRSPARRGCCARSSARSSTSQTTMFPGCAGDGGAARSSRRTTLRCATAARPHARSLATSCTPLPRSTRRS
jgi:transposase